VYDLRSIALVISALRCVWEFCTDPLRWHRRDPKIIFRAGKSTEMWNYDAAHRGEAIPELNSG